MEPTKIWTFTMWIISIGSVIWFLATPYTPPHQASIPKSPECQKLDKDYTELSERQLEEVTKAVDQEGAEDDVEWALAPSQTEAEGRIAWNNLSAKQKIATAMRENRQENELAIIEEQLRTAGCSPWDKL